MNGASLRDPGRAYHELTMRIMDLQEQVRSSNGGRYDTQDYQVIDDCLNIIFDYFKGDEIIAPEDSVLDYMRLVLDGAEMDGNDELSTRMERAIQAYRADPNESYCLATEDDGGSLYDAVVAYNAGYAETSAADAAGERQLAEPSEAWPVAIMADTITVGGPLDMPLTPAAREVAARNLRRGDPLWYCSTPEMRNWLDEYDHSLANAWEASVARWEAAARATDTVDNNADTENNRIDTGRNGA